VLVITCRDVTQWRDSPLIPVTRQAVQLFHHSLHVHKLHPRILQHPPTLQLTLQSRPGIMTAERQQTFTVNNASISMTAFHMNLGLPVSLFSIVHLFQMRNLEKNCYKNCYRPDVLPATQPAVSKHRTKHITDDIQDSSPTPPYLPPTPPHLPPRRSSNLNHPLHLIYHHDAVPI